MKEVNNSSEVKLKATAREFNFNQLRASKDNKSASSGETMFLDFPRMNFIINGKEVDSNFIKALYKGAETRKSELFNRDEIYSYEIDKIGEREIDTKGGRTFVNSVLEDIEEGLAQNAFNELWKSHCENSEISEHLKTDLYREELEEFYNAGRKCTGLLSSEEKDYRSFAKEVFKRMFKYNNSEIPNDAILEELVINCNQAGYEAYMQIKTQLSLGESFMVIVPNKIMNIDCANQNEIRIRSDMKLSILPLKEGLLDVEDGVVSVRPGSHEIVMVKFHPP